MNALFKFIEDQCLKYNIDESHGLKHAQGTFIRAKLLLGTLAKVDEAERRVALYAAALHDTCDSKYCPVMEASSEIKEFLLTQGWIQEEADAVVKIVNTMSYSKLKAASIDGHALYPDHGIWQRAYHVARNADLLEAYIVARCVLYTVHVHPTKSADEHGEKAAHLFKDRVFKSDSEGKPYCVLCFEKLLGHFGTAHLKG